MRREDGTHDVYRQCHIFFTRVVTREHVRCNHPRHRIRHSHDRLLVDAHSRQYDVLPEVATLARDPLRAQHCRSSSSVVCLPRRMGDPHARFNVYCGVWCVSRVLRVLPPVDSARETLPRTPTTRACPHGIRSTLGSGCMRAATPERVSRHEHTPPDGTHRGVDGRV